MSHNYHVNNDDVELQYAPTLAPAPAPAPAAPPAEGAATATAAAAEQYVEDADDFKAQQLQPRCARLTALVLGWLSLAVIGGGIYFFMRTNDYTLTRTSSASQTHQDFQGVVALAEIQDHDEPQDCWMALHGNVYDLTDYAPSHPGSSTLITMHCGTDATMWYDFEHSLTLLFIVDQYLLGTLAQEQNDAEEQKVLQEEVVPEEDIVHEDNTQEEYAEGDFDQVDEVSFEVQGELSVTKEPATDMPSNYTTDIPTNAPTTTSPTQNPTNLTTVPTETPSLAPLTDASLPVPLMGTLQPTYIPTTTTPTSGPTTAEIVSTSAPTLTPTTVAPTTKSPTTLEPTLNPTTAAPVGCSMEFYTPTDLAQHSDQESCWYGLYGVVYDLTWYIDQHKGGRGTILVFSGTDATTSFASQKKHDVDLLDKKGFASSIIGRVGTTRGSQSVPCDEINRVAVL